MEFTHNQQIEHLETLQHEAKSPLERTMLNDIRVSVLDSRSHRTMSGNMIRVEMNYERYKKYMKLVVEPERYEGPREANEIKIISAFELQK